LPRRVIKGLERAASPLAAGVADRVAVVTGATGGIGQAVSLALAQGGARLVLIGRDERRLNAVVRFAKASATCVEPFRVDLTFDNQIEQLATAIKARFGRVDILIHSAGEYARGKLQQAPVGDFDAQYRANVRAPYVLTQSLLPMLSVHGGQIVFINSTAGLSGRAGASQYAATQHALRAVADSLREEVNLAGIRVLSVFLGRTATQRQLRIHEAEGRTYQPELLLQPADVASAVMGALCLSHTAEVTDITIRPAIKSY
jgi:NADP-dependent 3-hydroxy acid dehydrogenase YdfG